MWWSEGYDKVPSFHSGKTVVGNPKEIKHWIDAHSSAILAVRFNQRGNRFLTCGGEKIKVWNFETGKCIDILKDGSSNYKDVDVALNDERFASCDDAGQIFFWDLSTSTVLGKFQCQAGEQLNAVRCYEDGAVLAAVDRSLVWWDYRSNDGVLTKAGPFKSDIKSLSLIDTNIVAGCIDGIVCKLDLRSMKSFTLSLGQPLNCISLSHDGNCALASCLDSKLRLLNMHPTRKKIEQVYEGHVCSKSLKTDCCFINRDKLNPCVAVGSEDGDVCIWNALNGEKLSKFNAHSAPVTSIALHPEDKRMITASKTGIVRFWELPRW